MTPSTHLCRNTVFICRVRRSHRTHIVVTDVPEVKFVCKCDKKQGRPDDTTEWCPVRLKTGDVFEPVD